MEQWIKVATLDTFQGEVMVYEHEDWPIAIFRLEDGYFAVDDTCTHEEASLATGEIEDGRVECPLHGAIFDIRSGKNLSLPAVLPLKSYPVKIEHGDILLKVS